MFKNVEFLVILRMGIKSSKLEIELEKARKTIEQLEKFRNEIGEIGGARHFFGNDKGIDEGGVRNWMEENELKKVLRLLAAGEKEINLKFLASDNWEVAEAGWTIQFKSAWKSSPKDG